jgi:hypothetical protein
MYFGYDSVGQHIAAGSGLPMVVVFSGYPNEVFPVRWAPYSTKPTLVVRVPKKRKGKTEEIAEEVLGNFRELIVSFSPVIEFTTLNSHKLTYFDLAKAKPEQSTRLAVVLESVSGQRQRFMTQLPNPAFLGDEQKRQELEYYLNLHLFNLYTMHTPVKMIICAEDCLKDSINNIIRNQKTNSQELYRIILEAIKRINGRELEFEVRDLSYAESLTETTSTLAVFDWVSACSQMKDIRGKTLLGLDIGGSNIRIIIVQDGQIILVQNYRWSPKKFNSWVDYQAVEDLVRLAVIRATIHSLESPEPDLLTILDEISSLSDAGGVEIKAGIDQLPGHYLPE